LTRLACLPMLAVMVVAMSGPLTGGEGFAGASHPIEDAIVLLALLITGAGRYSVDSRLAGPSSWG
jgi:uncharacterized membrane protein YphA (DoxX/SURF4 family)